LPRWSVSFISLSLWLLLGASVTPNSYADAAIDVDAEIAASYAYLDKLPDGRVPQSIELDRERAAVHDEDTLLRYAEDRLISLADHHAITGSSFSDSWAVIPTFSDLWVARHGDTYVISAVRDSTPSADSGIRSGDRLVAVNDVPIARAVSAFWARLGLSVTPRRADYAARVLAAGRRDRDRVLTVEDSRGRARRLRLTSMYHRQSDGPPISVTRQNGCSIIRINNSLGDMATIAAFDTVLATGPVGDRIVLDLRETPSGGNTTVARAIMGWFVNEPRSYQVHNRPAEERETGVARQWIEQVLPRRGLRRQELPSIWVGRWTGSMGEGLAIGFAALGADVRGMPMSGLNGSVEDLPLGTTGLVIKLPTERLMTVGGLPREDFIPHIAPLECSRLSS
jgi:hypothetical protein